MPTYDELQKDLKKNGITLSKYDDYYAQNDPNFGYNIMNAKLDYMNAATPEAKALANASAESYRAKLGYSGGGDGEGYILLDNEPARGLGSYGDPSSSFFNKYMGDYGDPNGYDAQYRSTLNGLLNYKPFSYDVNADPLYQSYKQQYTRNGELAMRDTLGQVSARTGGLASSYAATAANQAYNGYMQALSDRIPDLYQIAYQQYMDEYNRRANGLQMLDSARSTDYGRWQDDQSRLLNAFNISAQNEAAALAAAGRGGGVGNPTPASYGSGIPTELYKQLVQSGDASAISSYWNQMTQNQQNVLARVAGLTADELRSGMGSNADLVVPLLANRFTPASSTADGNPGWTSAELLEAAAAGMSRAQIEQALKDRGVDTSDLALRKQITWALGK